MADDLGAVRRTPRPTGDRQTPETGPQESAGTTNTASPVSGDQPAVSSRVSSQGEPAFEAATLAVLEAFNPMGDDPVYPTRSTEFAAYVAEQVEQALIGAGWRRPRPDGTVFEAPLAVHFAGPYVTIGKRRRQLCAWCGHVLLDVQLAPGQEHEPWFDVKLVRVEDGTTTRQPYTYGDPLPPGCCALPDDGEPVCICSVESTRCPDCRDEDQTDEDEPTCSICEATELCDHCADDGWTHVGPKRTKDGPDEAQETRATDWPAEETDHG